MQATSVGSSIPASKVYTEEGIIQVSPASTNPKLLRMKVDQTYSEFVEEMTNKGEVAGKFLAKEYKGKKLQLFMTKLLTEKGLADATKMNIDKNGLKRNYVRSYYSW